MTDGYDEGGDAAIAEPLAPEFEIALNYTPTGLRNMMRAYFVLDRRLARIVAQTTEPMLGQMRLAWWRDNLTKPIADRPAGDACLELVSAHWAGHEQALTSLVDGWEEMLVEPPLSPQSAQAFAKGRGQAFLTLAQMVDPSVDAIGAQNVGMRWAMVDAAVHIPEGEERTLLLNLAAQIPNQCKMPRSACGLAILNGLSARSLKNGGAPLMQGRGAALLCVKVGLLGQ